MTPAKLNPGRLEELKEKEFRDAYVDEHVCLGIPFQIRALRKQRGWNQAELAAKSGKTQSAISEMETEEEGRFQLRTLMEIASAFDVALVVKFVPYGKFLQEIEDLSPQGLGAESFEDELPRLIREAARAIKEPVEGESDPVEPIPARATG